jgi:hypothetical protein
MMTGRLLEEARSVPHCPTLGVLRRENETRHARETDRARAHRARFKGHEQIGANQPLVFENGRGGAQHQNLGMRCRIAPLNDPIPVSSQNPPTNSEHRADRHLAAFCGRSGLGQRGLHAFFVQHWRLPLRSPHSTPSDEKRKHAR